MQILPISNKNINNANNQKPSFGKILPEHLFINASGYDKDIFWAEKSIKTIEQAKTKISKKIELNNLIDFISNQYAQALGKSEGPFGELRETRCSTGIFGRYNNYKENMRNLVRNHGTKDYSTQTANIYSHNFFIFYYTSPYSNKNIPLSEIHMRKINGSSGYTNTESIELTAPSENFINPVFAEMESIYKKIFSNKQKTSPENLKQTTEEIATIHWLMSQVRPYKRGSAGIADILAKTLFEAKGIQVSKYKDNLDPNMEAFIMPVEEYVKSYENFFSKPLELMTKN